MGKIDTAVKLIKEIAADNSHGYSQYNRNGNPDFDCSSLVIYVLKQAGFKLDGATYTGNMLKPLLAAGFKDVTKTVTLSSGKGLKVGDILLNVVNHVEMVTGSGKVTGARSDEYGGIAGRNKGDQTGKEIAEASYYNYPWDHVLRYTETEKKSTGKKSSVNIEALAIDTIYGRTGYGEDRKKKLGANFDAVQKRVNEYYATARRVIRGDYLNEPERSKLLKSAGYDSAVVQDIVNWLRWSI